MKNEAGPDPAAHPGLVSLSLSHSQTPFILRVPLDPAGAGPQQEVPELGPKGKPLIVQFSGWLGPHQGITPPSPT